MHQRQQHLGPLEGDGAEFEREAVGEEDGLEGGRAREFIMVVAGGRGGASPAPAAGFLLRHDCCGCGGGEGSIRRFRSGRSLAPSASPCSASLDSGW